MSGLISGLISYATAFIVLVGVGLVSDVWRHKESFEIAARSPLLLCLAGGAHVALVFMQMIAQIVDSSFPCTITIWASYMSFGTISTAYLLRAARLVVVYDKDLRRKYKRLVKPSVQRTCMVAALSFCCILSLVIQLRFAASRRESGVCLFFEEGHTVFLPITLLYLAAMVAMASRLKDTDDAFQIRNEMGYICLATATTSGLRTIHITLIKYVKWWSDSDQTLPPTVHDLAACWAALFISFYRPLKAFYGMGTDRRSLRGVHSARKIFSGGGEDTGGLAETEKNAGEANMHRRPEAWGVLQMLRNETLRVLLVNFCERSLCGESIDFLADVVFNYESLADAEQQFGALSDIVETYLAQGSVHEVNVSNSYRNEAAGWVSNRDAFLELEEERRTHVLDRQRDEIAKMLSENLMFKFKQTPMVVDAMRALKDMIAASGDATGDEEDQEDADMKSMLKASAAAEVARIKRMGRVDNAQGGGGPFGFGGSGSGVKVRRCDSLDEDSIECSDSMASYTLSM